MNTLVSHKHTNLVFSGFDLTLPQLGSSSLATIAGNVRPWDWRGTDSYIFVAGRKLAYHFLKIWPGS